MLVYRLVQAPFHQEPLSGEGAARYGGRWNPRGFALLYTTESPALSLLEILVHLNPRHIPDYHLVTIDVPDSIRVYEQVQLPAQWRATGSGSPLPSQTFLLPWLQQPDTLLVRVPSAVLPGMANYLLHPRHPLFAACRMVQNEPFEINSRLYDPAKRRAG